LPKTAPKAARKSLAELMRSSEAEAQAKPRMNVPAAPAQLVVKSISLTPAAEETLARLMQASRSRIGRKVSASSVVRALLDHCERHQLDDVIADAIEAELNNGSVIWGSRRGS